MIAVKGNWIDLATLRYRLSSGWVRAGLVLLLGVSWLVVPVAAGSRIDARGFELRSLTAS